MDVNQFFTDLDRLFADGQTGKVDAFLRQSLQNARSQGDSNAELSILNEMIGYYRSVSRDREAADASEYALSKMRELGYVDTPAYGTTLLNAATAYRASGNTSKALELYTQAYEILGRLLPENDYRMAGLYNNMSAVYEETGEYDRAREFLEKALPIVASREESRTEAAVVCTNLALIYFKLGQDIDAMQTLQTALQIFAQVAERSGAGSDPHYAAALAGLAEACYRTGMYKRAVEVYEMALNEIECIHGRNRDYAVTCKNCALALDTLGERERATAFRKMSEDVMRKIEVNADEWSGACKIVL